MPKQRVSWPEALPLVEPGICTVALLKNIVLSSALDHTHNSSRLRNKTISLYMSLIFQPAHQPFPVCLTKQNPHTVV